MSSTKSKPAARRGNDRVLTIDWSLLWRRAKIRIGQLYTSLRHRAGRTEYIPPAWLQRFRFSWFRLGLMALALFIFTQRQVDFTVSVGREGLAMGTSQGRHMAVQGEGAANKSAAHTMSLLPLADGGAHPVQPSWNVESLNAQAVRQYVGRFEKVAKGEEEKYSIPAPASMALAILYSDAGQSPQAKRNNNHFALVGDDTYYDNAWMNWRAHSDLILKRYPQLAHESVNYQQWIAALAKTDYSSDKQLASKVMDIVEKFGLERL